jgi:hypothetical protein
MRAKTALLIVTLAFAGALLAGSCVIIPARTTSGGRPLIMPFSTALPTFLIPTIRANTTETRTYLQWAPVADATSYEIWIDTRPDFSTAQQFTGLPASIFTPPADLTLGAVYYWRVRAIEPAGPTGWSDTWSFVPAILPAP